MRLLMVHQNFPGQFRDLAPALLEQGHEIKAIGSSQRPVDGRIEVRRYQVDKPEKAGVHPLTAEVDEWIRRGEAVAKQAEALRREGWAPDVMLAHPGWGEAMLLRHVYAASPLLVWPELWLRPEHMGTPREQLSIEQAHYLRVKNWILDGALADAQLAVVATAYQASSFPERWQHKLRVIHEGVPDGLFQQQRLASLTLSPEVTLGPNVPVITFISRNLEPMRGFPEFMRALPTLQRALPQLHAVVVGGDELSYSGGPGDGQCWRERLLQELDGQLDRNRLHLFGRMPHGELIKLYRRSNLHVYLSRPFVLSWSLIEVMACGTPILAADNPMLREVVQAGVNGWFVQRPEQPQLLANAIQQALQQELQPDRQNLRQQFSQQHTLLQLVELLQTIGSGWY